MHKPKRVAAFLWLCVCMRVLCLADCVNLNTAVPFGLFYGHLLNNLNCQRSFPIIGCSVFYVISCAKGNNSSIVWRSRTRTFMKSVHSEVCAKSVALRASNSSKWAFWCSRRAHMCGGKQNSLSPHPLNHFCSFVLAFINCFCCVAWLLDIYAEWVAPSWILAKVSNDLISVLYLFSISSVVWAVSIYYTTTTSQLWMVNDTKIKLSEWNLSIILTLLLQSKSLHIWSAYCLQ